MQPDAPWPPFMDHVQVIAFAGNFKSVPDDVLVKAFAKMKQKHIAFAIESLAQSWVGFPEHCGHGVEGYTDPPGNAAIARKIKAAGGELTYVTMDGPFSSGHYYDGPNACHDPIPVVAARAAAVMREYKKVFPNVQIGDTEPFPSGPASARRHITKCDNVIARQSTTPEHHDRNHATLRPYSRAVFGERPNASRKSSHCEASW